MHRVRTDPQPCNPEPNPTLLNSLNNLLDSLSFPQTLSPQSVNMTSPQVSNVPLQSQLCPHLGKKHLVGFNGSLNLSGAALSVSAAVLNMHRGNCKHPNEHCA